MSSKKKIGNRPKTAKAEAQEAQDLWIAPKSNLKGDSGDRAWDGRRATSTGSRLLELADIALGLRKPEPLKKRRSAAASSGR